MAKKSMTIKKELLNVYKQEREDKRCHIVKTLMNQGKVITASVDNEIRELNTKLNELNEQKSKMLRDAKLSTFNRGYGTCILDELHPTLISFDEETNKGIREILEGD